jgi:hypothetical protein
LLPPECKKENIMRLIIALIMVLTFPVFSFAVKADGYEEIQNAQTATDDELPLGAAKADSYYEEEDAKAALRAEEAKRFVGIPELTRAGKNLAKKFHGKDGFDISIEEAELFVGYAGRAKNQAYILTIFNLSSAKGNPEWQSKYLYGLLAVPGDAAEVVGEQCGLQSPKDLFNIAKNVCAMDQQITWILENNRQKKSTKPEYAVVLHTLFRLNIYAEIEAYKT